MDGQDIMHLSLLVQHYVHHYSQVYIMAGSMEDVVVAVYKKRRKRRKSRPNINVVKKKKRKN